MDSTAPLHPVGWYRGQKISDTWRHIQPARRREKEAYRAVDINLVDFSIQNHRPTLVSSHSQRLVVYLIILLHVGLCLHVCVFDFYAFVYIRRLRADNIFYPFVSLLAFLTHWAGNLCIWASRHSNH